jgi:peptidoglycan/LPS O-acetylase OafA/YrhL
MLAKTPDHQRVDVIDGLRGMAILAVICYHTWLVSGQEFSFAFSGFTFSLQFIAATGFLGVDLFFFLSGFCLFYPCARRHFDGRAPQPLREFVHRRALKIVPSYLIALTVFALPFHDHFSSWFVAVGQYAAHLFFVHPFFAPTFDSISGPFWTLGIEVQFYLLFPIIAWVVRSWPIRGYIGILLIAEAYRGTLIATQHANQFFPVNQLPAFLDIFTGGMVAAYAVVWARNNVDVARYRKVLTAVAAAAFAGATYGLVLLAASPALQSPDTFFEWQSRYRPAIALILIVIAVSSVLATQAWQRALANPLLLFFSTISYNLYLWHLEIFVWIHQWNAPEPLVLAVSLTAAILTATLITYAFELPILRGDWRLPARWRLSALPGFNHKRSAG